MGGLAKRDRLRVRIAEAVETRPSAAALAARLALRRGINRQRVPPDRVGELSLAPTDGFRDLALRVGSRFGTGLGGN